MPSIRAFAFTPSRGRLTVGLLVVTALLLATGCKKSDTKSTAPAPVAPPAAPSFAVIETDKGIIEFELLSADAPKTTENFRILAGRGYYNGLIFHRIIKDFMIQGGDPLGDGRGGESAWGGKFADEIVKDSPLYQNGLGYKRGMVAMANAGKDTNGSQFFILHKDYPLPPSYTIFGRVTKGIEVVDALAAVPTTYGMGGMSKPMTPPVMKKVTIR